MSTRDIDLGWGKFMDNMVAVDDSYTKVGLPENATLKPGTKSGSGADEASDMSELIKIGAIHEFGTKNIPSRPFMRNTFDQNRTKINKIQQVMYDRLVKGNTTVKKGLGIIGESVSRLVKKQITDLRSPPNKPSTIKRKRSSNPLIDSAQMRNSISHTEVTRGI